MQAVPLVIPPIISGKGIMNNNNSNDNFFHRQSFLLSILDADIKIFNIN
jgi:hypothetical protein